MLDLAAFRVQLLLALGISLASCSSGSGPDATAADSSAVDTVPDTPMDMESLPDGDQELDTETADLADIEPDLTPLTDVQDVDVDSADSNGCSGTYGIANVQCFPLGSGESPYIAGQYCFPWNDIGDTPDIEDQTDLEDTEDSLATDETDVAALPDAETAAADAASSGPSPAPKPLPPNQYPQLPEGCAAPIYGQTQYDYDRMVSEVAIKDGQCCYTICWTGIVCGRPLTIADQQRTAPLAEGSAWSATAGTAETSAHSAALGAAWRADALDEHASVASFGRFVLELLAFGAPPQLVRDVLAAASDEVRHAEVCFGIATQLDGHAQGPGALDLADMQLATSLAEAAAAAVREGCVGETLAAAHAATASRQTSDPALAQALAAIADDEARHAALAWRFVQWACGQGDPAVGPAVQAAFAAALATPPTARAADLALAGVPAAEQHAAGRLPAVQASALYRAVLADVVGPCARALVG
jgi:hypothetical protein